MSGKSFFPKRLTKIDELTISDHFYLDKSDECYYFGEYTARENWAFSETNKVILNFKKPTRFKNTASWKYKVQEIANCAKAFSNNLETVFSDITLVPVPPSKLKTDPEYDNRMAEMLASMKSSSGYAADFRELIIQNTPMAAAHEGINRAKPDEWSKVYEIQKDQCFPEPTWIGIVDDLVVTGCRFRAMQSVLKKRFPNARVTGLFLARRVPNAIDVSNFNDI